MTEQAAVMMCVTDAPGGEPDSELVRAELTGGFVTLVREDGERLTFDAAELRSALAPAALRRAA